MRRTQKEMVLDYIARFGSISPMEAFADLGITKLATRVSELRAEGVPVAGKLEKAKNRFGQRVVYMRYSMPQEVNG